MSHRGIAIYRAKLITKGRVFGEDMILSSPILRSNAQAKAMNYLEVYFTTRAELFFIARRYPKTAQAIRRAAVMIALRREVIAVAKLRLGISPSDKIGAVVNMMLGADSRDAAPQHSGQLALMDKEQLIALKAASGAGKDQLFGVDGSSTSQSTAFDGAGLPEELPEDAVIPDELPPVVCSLKAIVSEASRGPTDGPKSLGAALKRASSPLAFARRASPTPGGRTSPTPGGHTSPYMEALRNQNPASSMAATVANACRDEIDRLRSELREEMQAREAAQREAAKAQQELAQRSFDLASRTAQQVEEVLLKRGGCKRLLGPAGALGALPADADVAALPWTQKVSAALEATMDPPPPKPAPVPATPAPPPAEEPAKATPVTEQPDQPPPPSVGGCPYALPSISPTVVVAVAAAAALVFVAFARR